MDLVVLSVAFVMHEFIVYGSSYPFVTIPDLGKIQGSFTETFGGRQISSFRGIPYALPPVGPLRFAVRFVMLTALTLTLSFTVDKYRSIYCEKDPIPASPWNGVLDATKEGPYCVQFIFGRSYGVEDCLKLNIYTHSVMCIFYLIHLQTFEGNVIIFTCRRAGQVIIYCLSWFGFMAVHSWEEAVMAKPTITVRSTLWIVT